jgi:MFS family permease
MTMFSAFFLAPFLGGMLVDQWGYKFVFALSGGGRVIATLLFLFVVTMPARARNRVRRPEAPKATNAPELANAAGG